MTSIENADEQQLLEMKNWFFKENIRIQQEKDMIFEERRRFEQEKAKFEHAGIMQRLRMIYTFACDLESLHDTRTIAQSIGAPMLLIAAMKTIHRMLTELRQRG